MRIGIGIGIGFQGFLGAAGPTLQALEITWDNISNVPVADASSVDDWNTFFDLPTNGTPFTSVEVIGNLVKLYGGSGITVAGNLFDTNTNLISINDNIESIITAGEESFFNCTSATSFNFPNLTAAGIGCFDNCTSATSFNFPNLTAAGDGCFIVSSSATSFNFPNLTAAGSGCFALCTSATEFFCHYAQTWAQTQQTKCI
jgi:hypothetical protein